jgi:hypothetical protein
MISALNRGILRAMPHKVLIDIQDLLVWAFRTQRVEFNPHADIDALTTYWAVIGLPDAHAGLIKRHARAATEPNWQIATGPLVSLSQVRMARLVYSEWVRSLTVLRETLSDQLRYFEVHGPHLSEEPWSRLRA